MQLKHATVKKNLHANSIRFYRIRGGGKGAATISRTRVYFWERSSLTLFLFFSFLLSPWMQVQVGDYRYRLSPPLISRTTVLRNTENWHPRETRKEWEKKGLEVGGDGLWQRSLRFPCYTWTLGSKDWRKVRRTAQEEQRGNSRDACRQIKKSLRDFFPMREKCTDSRHFTFCHIGS